MSTRWPRKVFDVEVVYIRDYVARKVVSVVVGGRGVWALLPDGRVGTNDGDFFRRAYGHGTRAEVHIAEKLWRLGKLAKGQYKKIEAAYERGQARKEKVRLAGELKGYAKQLGMPLTKEQQAAIEKLAA